MRLPKIDWLPFVILAAVLAVGGLVCARWPVTEDSATPPPGFPRTPAAAPPAGANVMVAKMAYRFIRRPTFSEWTVRFGLFCGAIALMCVAWAAGQRLEKYLK